MIRKEYFSKRFFNFSFNADSDSSFRVRPKVKRKNKKQEKLTRKKPCVPAGWVDSKAKKARNTGQLGTDRKGKTILPRRMRAGCGSECRFSCCLKISLAERRNVFDNFWKLGDKSRHWDSISQWVTTGAPATKSSEDSDSEMTNLSNKSKKKQRIHIFTLPTNRGLMRVCKKMFLDTLGQ